MALATIPANKPAQAPANTHRHPGKVEQSVQGSSRVGFECGEPISPTCTLVNECETGCAKFTGAEG